MTPFASLAFAAVMVTEPATLDADDAVRRAVAHAPVLEAQRAFIAREVARASRVEIDPLHFHFDHRAAEQVFGPRYDNNGTPYGPLDRTYWSLGVRAPALSQLGFDQAVDARRADALGVELEQQRRSIAAEVRLLHAAALLRAEEAALVREAIAIGTRMRDAVNAKVAAEAATALDQSAAELELLDLTVELDDVEGQRARAEAHLGRLIASEGAVRAAGTLPACKAPPSAAELLVLATDRSPRLRSLAFRDLSLDAEGVANALRFVPWLDEVTLGYLNEPTDRRDELRAVVEIDVPVFAFLDGKGHDLELRRARVSAERREAEIEIADEVAAAVDRLRTAAELVERHAAATDAIARRSTAAVDAVLSSGTLDVITASEVYARALKSQRAHLRARERCAEAAIELQRVTGDVLPADAASR
jgi:outer membrane protein TolC